MRCRCTPTPQGSSGSGWLQNGAHAGAALYRFSLRSRMRSIRSRVPLLPRVCEVACGKHAAQAPCHMWRVVLRLASLVLWPTSRTATGAKVVDRFGMTASEKRKGSMGEGPRPDSLEIVGPLDSLEIVGPLGQTAGVERLPCSHSGGRAMAHRHPRRHGQGQWSPAPWRAAQTRHSGQRLRFVVAGSGGSTWPPTALRGRTRRSPPLTP